MKSRAETFVSIQIHNCTADKVLALPLVTNYIDNYSIIIIIKIIIMIIIIIIIIII